MHVVIVSTFFPYPQNCGKARVLGGLCAFLAGHPKITRLSYFHIAKRPAEEAARLSGDYHHEAGPGGVEILRNLARPLLSGRLPALQEVLTFSRESRRRLINFLKEERPDVVVADTIRAAQYLEHADRPDGRYLLYLDDLFSLRYERILGMMERFPQGAGDTLGNFVSFVPAKLRGFAARPRWLKLLLEYERNAVRRRENEVVRHFDRSFLISPDEVSILRDRSGRESVYPLKLLTEGGADPERCDGRAPYFVFLGDLKLPHNRIAIENLIRHGAAAIERFLPGYHVLVVGKSAPDELIAACAQTRNFHVEGYVPDLETLLIHARGLLAPLLFGSGVKIKCLEALRLGVPIVASRIGVEGLTLRPDAEYLPADDIPAVVRQMQRLTEDREHARFSTAGRDWFATNYAHDVVWREYEHLLFDRDPLIETVPPAGAAA